jgi:hypothetical protein
MTFYVTPGINADHISISGDRLCLVQGALPASPMNAPPIGDNHNLAPYAADYVSFPNLHYGSTTLVTPGAVEAEDTPEAPEVAEVEDKSRAST